MGKCSCRRWGEVVDASHKTKLPLNALRAALDDRKPAPGLIHHSDRGCQYASCAVRAVLSEHGLQASMSRKGNGYDNAVAERFFPTLKVELVHDRRFATRAEAKAAVFDYIEVFYNRTRVHSTLDYKSPVEFEVAWAAIRCRGPGQQDPRRRRSSFDWGAALCAARLCHLLSRASERVNDFETPTIIV